MDVTGTTLNIDSEFSEGVLSWLVVKDKPVRTKFSQWKDREQQSFKLKIMGGIQGG